MAVRRALTFTLIAGLAVAACTGPGATSTPTQTTAATATAEPTASPTQAPTASPTPQADACAVEGLVYKNSGRLTLSTDIPSFPPWFVGAESEQWPNEPAEGGAWNGSGFSDPYSGQGFESAVAYAVAEAMGFTPDLVDWIANPDFALAFAPGEKPFDFHMAQISITPERAEAVDFSDPYFDSNQSVIALTSNDIIESTSIADLKDERLAAAQNTTSFEFIVDVIMPTPEVQSPLDNTAALGLLQGDVVDGLVVDLSSAFFMRDAQLEDFDTPDPEATIVGQFGPPAEPDHMGFVLEKDSTLTACVSQALAEIKGDGTHQAILDEWVNTGENIPFLE